MSRMIRLDATSKLCCAVIAVSLYRGIKFEGLEVGIPQDLQT